MRRLSRWLLDLAERLALRAHGWHRDGSVYADGWRPPSDWSSKRAQVGATYHQDHAVNSVKFYSRSHA